jgi:hypothetical protein
MHGRHEKYVHNFGCKILMEDTIWKNKVYKGKILLKWILKEYDSKIWTGFNWLKIGISGRILCV